MLLSLCMLLLLIYKYYNVDVVVVVEVLLFSGSVGIGHLWRLLLSYADKSKQLA